MFGNDDRKSGESGYWISRDNNGRTAGFPVFHVFADEDVPDERMIHVAGVAAQLLDKNEDLRPDGGSKTRGSGITLAHKLRDNYAHITIHSSTMMLKSNEKSRQPMFKYFDPTYFKSMTGIEGPFGWLRGGYANKDGSPAECRLDLSNDKCGNDIYPNMWYDPNRDLTQREVMKAIIGYGLRYTDPGRFGGPAECYDNSRCKYNYRKKGNGISSKQYRSLLQNAYEHATGESPHPNFEDYTPHRGGKYTAPTVLFDNRPTIDAMGKYVNDKKPKRYCKDDLEDPSSTENLAYHCWSTAPTDYHKMLAYGVMGYLTYAETDNRKDTKYTPDPATRPTEGRWKVNDKDGEPTLDHLLFDLIDYICRDYKDWKKAEDGCPDGLPASSSRRCKNYSIARKNFVKRHDGYYNPKLCQDQIKPSSNQNQHQPFVATAAAGTSGYTWNTGDFSVRVFFD